MNELELLTASYVDMVNQMYPNAKVNIEIENLPITGFITNEETHHFERKDLVTRERIETLTTKVNNYLRVESEPLS